MEYDHDKVDEMVLALMYLNVHDVEQGWGARAWKGFDWGAMDRLYEKGYIDDPKSKAKSVALTQEGLAKWQELFERHFGSG